ncbi:MAG: hypothetical protein RL077_5158 [Verrucomicrobiota bacterium]
MRQGRELGGWWGGDLALLRTLPTEPSEWGPTRPLGESGPHRPLSGRGVSGLRAAQGTVRTTLGTARKNAGDVMST